MGVDTLPGFYDEVGFRGIRMSRSLGRKSRRQVVRGLLGTCMAALARSPATLAPHFDGAFRAPCPPHVEVLAGGAGLGSFAFAAPGPLCPRVVFSEGRRRWRVDRLSFRRMGYGPFSCPHAFPR